MASERGFSGVDIFLSGWPSGITNKLSSEQKPTSLDETVFSNMGEIYNATLAQLLKPRYHFTNVANLFWQRLPYRNGITGHITRFITLATVDEINTDKNKKWIHALNLVPMNGEIMNLISLVKS